MAFDVGKLWYGGREKKGRRKGVPTSLQKEALSRAHHKCQSCHKRLRAVWHIHHRDGNPNNNRLSNLRVLCPTCHAEEEHKKRIRKRTRKTTTQKRRKAQPRRRPKTARGTERKLLTGDGRKSISKHYFPSLREKKRKKR